MKKILLLILIFLSSFFFLTKVFFSPLAQAQADCLGTVKTIDWQGNPMPGITITCTDCGTTQSSCTTDGAEATCQIDFGKTCLYPCAYHLTSSNPDCVFQEGYSVDCGMPDVPPSIQIICKPSDGSESPVPGIYPPPDDEYDDENLCEKSKATDWEIRSSWPDNYCCDCGRDNVDCQKGFACLIKCNDCDKNCNLTNYLAPDCAQSFVIHHPLKVSRNDCDYKCGEKWYTQVKWDGEVSIDAGDTKVPFAGKRKDKLDAEANKDAGYEDEIRYLADYFEGTHEYYRDYFLIDTIIYLPIVGNIPIKIHGHNSTFLTDYQGVFRKLAPYEYQNDLKRLMVERGKMARENEPTYGAIHDYKVKYLERFCWNAPSWLEALIGVAELLGYMPVDVWKVLDFCLYNSSDTKPEHFEMELIEKLVRAVPGIKWDEEEKIQEWLSELVPPPKPDEENYLEAWNDWKKSDGGKWWRLWQVAPMTTREDTRGFFYPIPELRDDPEEYWAGPQFKIIRVPHLARLWEITRLTQQLLIPMEIERTSDQPLWATLKPQSPLIAQTVKDSCNKRLLKKASYSEKINRETSPVLSSQKIVSQEKSASPCGQAINQVLGETVLLAQGGLKCELTFSLDSCSCTPLSGGQYRVDMVISIFTCEDQGCAFNDMVVEVGGQWLHVCRNASECDSLLVSVTVSGSPGNTITIPVTAKGGSSEGCPNSGSWGVSITINEDGSCTCQGTSSSPPPIDAPACLLAPVPYSGECLKSGITDDDKVDTLCASEMTGKVYGIEEVENKYCEDGSQSGDPDCQCKNVTDLECALPIKNDCQKFCCKSLGAEAQRQFEVNTDLPYLTEIWNQTDNSLEGFFNILRPADVEPFTTIAAKDYINYGYAGSAGAHVEPDKGEFYYPYLGGVQLSKEWVIRALMPRIE